MAEEKLLPFQNIFEIRIHAIAEELGISPAEVLKRAVRLTNKRDEDLLRKSTTPQHPDPAEGEIGIRH